MKAVTIMYDSLNRGYLPMYGNTDVIAPNFARLASKAITFDSFYCGSMPCMPARRELHTGHYNFLHRSWSPLEPCDDSMPEILANSGICTQFISDHVHYWQDGGLTYQTRYSGFEMVRGQEGDEWHARAKGFTTKRNPKRQDAINREYTRDDNCCHARCFDAAKDFLEHNKDEDNWYLHLEYFDPHEPFDVPNKYKRLYTDRPVTHDWPLYAPVKDQQYTDEEIINYKASVSMCDDYLGQLLNLFDEYDLWKDTMILLCTDHGYLLGEHGYMAKNYMPCYDPLVHLPFLMYTPECKAMGGERRHALTQTIDIAPTLLDWFGKEIPDTMNGKSLLETCKTDKKVHDALLFGYFGKHINVTDGRYVYMRSARDNSALYEYTLMPNRLASRFTYNELKGVQGLDDSFAFEHHVPMLKFPAHTPDVPNASHHQYDEHIKYGDLLFDHENDKEENHNLVHDPAMAGVKERLIAIMKEMMKEAEAPKEQYTRMGF